MMRALIVTVSAALIFAAMVPHAAAAKSHLTCAGEHLHCGKLAKVCNPKNGRCCCARYGSYH
jgi:hypothetical protein